MNDELKEALFVNAMKATAIQFKCPHCGNRVSDIKEYDSRHLLPGKLYFCADCEESTDRQSVSY